MTDQPSGTVKPSGPEPTGAEQPSGTLKPSGPDDESAKQEELVENTKSENFYRSILQACLWMAGSRVTPEKLENLGRLDLEAVFGDLTYVIEIKMTKNSRGADHAVREGMNQIHTRGYGRSSDNPILVSLAIGREERNIVGCLFERDGQERKVEVEK
ncbi:MAG: PD-(D/E)XK nuclease domain-containing protein [Deltaproteobacteria bacterium]|nr:PD-(D/E)XK nuclease domain-containing protein [Deltaproteobacteria bacterium]